MRPLAREGGPGRKKGFQGLPIETSKSIKSRGKLSAVFDGAPTSLLGPLRDDFGGIQVPFRDTFSDVFRFFLKSAHVDNNTLYECFRGGREVRKLSKRGRKTTHETRPAYVTLF